MRISARAGRGLLQSREEWDERNRVLARSMLELTARFAPVQTGKALDVGCQTGVLTDAMAEGTDYEWVGVDPAIDKAIASRGGHDLRQGSANRLHFADESINVILLANVFEHSDPLERDASLKELARVLVPGGVVVGQIPNPYFPIESHSRLPFMGWLPYRVQKQYWRLAPTPWDHDFYVVTMRHIRRSAEAAKLEVVHVNNFAYPPSVVPRAVRWAARVLERPMRHFPWAWQFVLQRPVD